MEEINRSRRDALKIALGTAGGLVSLSAMGGTLRQLCSPTPAQTKGPFFPEATHPPDGDTDLTKVDGKLITAMGDRVYVQGQVTDTECRPISNALLTVWQACASGRYNHSLDSENNAPLDPNFQYWAKIRTDKHGRYTFKTIVPGAYPAAPGWIRPPHIHFMISKLGYQELTTQMYFKGNAYNAGDKILNDLSPTEREAVVAEDLPPLPEMDPNSKRYIFDIRLRSA